MELFDSVYGTLGEVQVSIDPVEVFRGGADVIILCGSFPRKQGMERSDLLRKNKDIFKVQGAAMVSAPVPAHCRVLVVGNPANTNAVTLATFAKDVLDPRNITALTRLDQNRATSAVA